MSRTRATEQLEALDDYLSGEGDAEAAERREEELFHRAARGEAGELAFAEKLFASMKDLAQRGSFDVTLTVAELEALQKRTPLKLRVFDPVADARASAGEALAELELVVWDFRVKLAGVDRVDLELGYRDQTLLVLPDVKVDREHDRVILCCEGDLARASVRPGTFTRVVGVEGGQRRTLAEFAYVGA